MKPPPFDLVQPGTLVEALVALDAEPDAAVLAGGQSLLQDLRWRRFAPPLVVDVGGVAELRGVTVDDDTVRLGALVRHVDLERGAVPGPLGTLLAETAGWIAHPPIRSRGTFAGSLAWAHPAAEWTAVAAALDAQVELASRAGYRTLPAAEFLHGPGATARRPGELIIAVTLPVLGEGTATGVAEHRRTHASFAHVAVVAAVDTEGDEVVRAHLGVAGAAPTARRAHAAEEALLDGGGPAAAADAVGEDIDPVEHPHADVDYTRHVAAVLVRRVLERLLDGDREAA
ncbi:FAD binding domain-containing protein [Actinomycetospora lemnae]|uniref:FAD binding domain-containing protein n=1 Tax=Actinomycetospora lemnae TaxID=3019891 RepID=A0ABT5T2R8_9PSEU|nr:FAD binding domain-containing protein [Actinomycetospora sp. DW7H6]MDD7968686.1 FAD binding domain-containing protein [Actinomycetospora sp. DW7H6]